MFSSPVIRVLGDWALTTPTTEIEKFDTALIEFSHLMTSIMYDKGGVGLAANQLGISRSLFVYDDRAGNAGTICNPSFIPIGDQIEECMEEGCLSIPGVFDVVNRFPKIRLFGKTVLGDTIELEADGLVAQIFQHETEHLQGKLYISHLPKESQIGIVMGNQVMRDRSYAGKKEERGIQINL